MNFREELLGHVQHREHKFRDGLTGEYVYRYEISTVNGWVMLTEERWQSLEKLRSEGAPVSWVAQWAQQQFDED